MTSLGDKILSEKRAMILAPLVPGLLWTVLMFNPAVLLFAVPLGYFAMIAFGLPLYFLVRRFLRVSVNTCVVGGVLAGGLTGLIFLWWSNSFEWSLWLTGGVSIFVGFGAIAGVSFWWLSSARKDAKLGCA